MNGCMHGPTPHYRGDRRGFYLRLIAASSSLFHLRQILSHTIVSGHHPDLPTTTKLIHRHTELSTPPSSALPLALFHSHPKPDLFLLNVLLRSLPAASALSLFSSLPERHPHLRPDSFTFSFSLSAAALLPSPSTGRALHARIIASNLGTDRFIGSALTDFYFKFSQTSNAEKVFDQIPQPDTVSWNSRISGLVRSCSFLRAVRAFGRMVALGNCIDSTTLAVVLPATADLQDLTMGKSMQVLGLKTGMADQPHVVTGLLSLYSKCDDIPAAEIIFEEIDQPDIIHCNVMISGYSSTGCITSSVALFRDLQLSGWRPNSSTLVALIPVTNPFGYESLCREIHGFVIKTRLDLDLLVSTALTTVYSRLNDIESARQVFDGTSEKSLASWNAMISGYAQNGLTELAISLFQDMQSLNFKPNPVTAASILSACAQLGALTLGKWVHRIITEEDLELNVYVCTALIDMYAKCGNITEARKKIFDDMPDKNVVSWNAMIFGYALHGYGHEALRLFRQMLYAQISPTATTFLSVLHGCSHGGLVEEGHDIFLSMPRYYGVRPRAEHYACMVDLLGRAERLVEALDFIKTAPENAGPGVWAAFLGACKIHKETSLAELASEKLFELEPENPGYYVLLSNIYSASHNFPEAAAVREAAKRKNLAKLPGCTIIEVKDVVHSFTAGDRSHPQASAIYSMLESLLGKIVEAGYQAETEAVFYDVEEEEKEQMIKIHSEKLAIAFGLINAKQGSEIRIIKNLRVCLDCHNWTKFISMVTKRVIVVRDASRFHHFRVGVCSCGDYW